MQGICGKFWKHVIELCTGDLVKVLPTSPSRDPELCARVVLILCFMVVERSQIGGGGHNPSNKSLTSDSSYSTAIIEVFTQALIATATPSLQPKKKKISHSFHKISIN